MLETAVCLLAIIALGVAFLVLRNFGIGYGNRKGSNRADLEDISRLTKLVEDIKHQNAEVLEAMKSRNQLRAAAIEKRLQAHQEAYRLWSLLVSSVFDHEIVRQRVQESWTWWLDNCLYLEPAAREAFRVAMATAPDHSLVVDANRGTANAEVVQKSWAGIFGAGDTILRAVALPGLSTGEEAQITRSAESNLQIH